MKRIREYLILFVIAAISIAFEPMFRQAGVAKWIPLILAGIIVIYYAILQESYMRVLFGIAGVVVVVDLWTKSLVQRLQLGAIWSPLGWARLSSLLYVVHWYNTGAAFGSFAGYGWVFTLIALVIVALIIYYYPRVENKGWWFKLALGMQMGGALGNVIDRLLHFGRVTDFISLANIAVVNVADISVWVGVFLLLIGIWLNDRRDRKEASTRLVSAGSENPLAEGAGSELAVNMKEASHE